jgi:hypothetical protein
MSGYELTIGGPRDDSSSDVYQNLLDLSISENPTAKNSWSASIPYDRSFEDGLLAEIFIYYEGDTIFRGILESVESSFDGSETTLSGRGVLVELAYETEVLTYSDTTVYEALKDYWANHTHFDPIVHPPNRDVHNESYVATSEIRGIFSFDNSPAGVVDDPHAYAEKSQLQLHRMNYTEDASVETMNTSGSDVPNSAYSNDTGLRLETDGYVEYDYSADFDNSDYGWYVRLQSSSTSATLDFYINGTHVRTWSLDIQSISHEWLDILNDSRLSSVNSAPSSLTENPTLRVEVSGLATDEWVDFDAMSATYEATGDYTLPSSTNTDNVYEGPEWYPQNTLVDGEPDDGYNGRLLDSETDRLWLLVETLDPVAELTADMKCMNTGEVVTETVSHDSPRTTHIFDYSFSNPGDEFAQKLYIDGEQPDTQSSSGETTAPSVSRFEFFVSDTSKHVRIDNTEFSGTKMEILEEIHDLGSYHATVTDYENHGVESFGQGTLNDEPFWRITSDDRTLDYSDYANKVTVESARLDDGTVNRATASDQDEIDVIGRTVHKFEKNPDMETADEVSTRAERLLEEKINERDESGSLEAVPMPVDVGYTYPVTPWSDVFRYGGRVGVNALELDPTDGEADYVRWDGTGIDSTPDIHTFEYLIYPRGLAELGDDEYQTLHSGYTEWSFETDVVRLYGDGSVELPYDNDNIVRSDPGVVNNRDTQRLSIVWGSDDDVQTAKFYVDGELKDKKEHTISYPWEDVNYQILGCDTSNNHAFDGGLDDVRLWYGEERTQSEIDRFKHEDLVEHPEADLTNLPIYLRFDDHSDTSTARIDGGDEYIGNLPTPEIHGATYEASFGQLEEVQYSLGDDASMSLKFDISGRVDTELIKMRNDVRRNQHNL